MNSRLLSRRIAAAAISLVAAFAGVNAASACQAGAGQAVGKLATGDRVEALSRESGKGAWTCPMHPEIHRHEAGKCPVCKMNLVKEKPKRA